jgi:hypothetical protein
MKTYAAIERAQRKWLHYADREKPLPTTLTDSERHALTDLLVSGMVRIIQQNPHLILRRLA